MAITLEKPKVTVVLIGAFDPSAAMPSKLGDANVIRADEAVAARLQTLMPGQVVAYSLEWCNVAILRDRFIADTTIPPFIKISDLIQKTISDLMPSASVTRLGINRQYSIKFSSLAERDSFGTRLVPPKAWGEWGEKIAKGIDADAATVHGGVMQVAMREMPVEGREGGWREVQIWARGSQLADGTSLAEEMMTLNDHFEVSDANQPAGLEPQELAQRRTHALLGILADQFDSSVNALDAIAKGIVRANS